MTPVNTVFVSKKGWQPVCVGITPQGELIWKAQMKQPWHLKMFPVQYTGDFSDQWMWICLLERGMDWNDESEELQ